MEITDTASDRFHVMVALKLLRAAQQQYHMLPRCTPQSDILWIHSTDLADPQIRFTVEELVKGGFLEYARIDYPPQDNWIDRFAPTAWRLTPRGMWGLEKSGEFIRGWSMEDG